MRKAQLKRKQLHSYTQEEITYIKKRIISYLESGFSESYALKQLHMGRELYRKMFAGDKDILSRVHGKYHSILKV